MDRLYLEARSSLIKVGVLIHRTGNRKPHAGLERITNEDCQATLRVKVTGRFESIEPEILNYCRVRTGWNLTGNWVLSCEVR